MTVFQGPSPEQLRDWQAVLGPAGGDPRLADLLAYLDPQPSEIETDTIGTAVAAAKTWNQIVVLKGSPTIATDGDRVLVAEASPRSLASAGTGDVLAGSIGAFLAQGVAPLDAAALAIFSGCRAAAKLTERFGTLGMVASDLPPAIAEELLRRSMDAVPASKLEEIIATAGIDVSNDRLAKLEYREAYPGYFTAYDPTMVEKLHDKGARYLYSTLDNPERVFEVLTGGQKSSFTRFSEGQLVQGKSSSADL